MFSLNPLGFRFVRCNKQNDSKNREEIEGGKEERKEKKRREDSKKIKEKKRRRKKRRDYFEKIEERTERTR